MPLQRSSRKNEEAAENNLSPMTLWYRLKNKTASIRWHDICWSFSWVDVARCYLRRAGSKEISFLFSYSDNTGRNSRRNRRGRHFLEKYTFNYQDSELGKKVSYLVLIEKVLSH